MIKCFWYFQWSVKHCDYIKQGKAKVGWSCLDAVYALTDCFEILWNE